MGIKCPTQQVRTYAGVVSRKSVRIALTHATLNNLKLCVCDVGDAYLQAPIRGKYYTKLNPKFGTEYERRYAYIIRAAYGLKEADVDFHNFSDCMLHLGYVSWMRTTTSGYAKQLMEMEKSTTNLYFYN